MADDDAVAAYLARERAALGEDADLFSGSGGNNQGEDVNAGSGSGMDGFPDLAGLSSPAAQQSNPAPVEPATNSTANDSLLDPMSNFPSFDAPTPANNDFKVTGHEGTGDEADEERARFESSFPDIGGEASAIETIPYGATPYPSQPYTAPQGQQSSGTGMGMGNGNGGHTYSSVLPAPQFTATQVAESDSPAIQAWREKQREEIKKRDEESKRKKEEVVLKAEKAIDAFYEKYNEQKERSIKKNKEDEKAFLETLQESISKGTTWERITDLVDLQNSQSKTLRASVPGGSDLARMKEILLSLRREGEKAPAAGGY